MPSTMIIVTSLYEISKKLPRTAPKTGEAIKKNLAISHHIPNVLGQNPVPIKILLSWARN